MPPLWWRENLAIREDKRVKGTVGKCCTCRLISLSSRFKSLNKIKQKLKNTKIYLYRNDWTDLSICLLRLASSISSWDFCCRQSRQPGGSGILQSAKPRRWRSDCCGSLKILFHTHILQTETEDLQIVVAVPRLTTPTALHYLYWSLLSHSNLTWKELIGY